MSANTAVNKSEYQRELLPLSAIRTDGGTQIRARLNRPAIDRYAALMREGHTFPPMVVFFDGREYWLAHGFHRLEGAKKAELDTIPAEIHLGTSEDARWYACGAHKEHGLGRSNKDKQRAVIAALNHPNGRAMSDGAIGLHVGVDSKTVARWRRRTDSTEIPECHLRTGADGRTIDVSNIGKGRRGNAQNTAVAVAPSAADLCLETAQVEGSERACDTDSGSAAAAPGSIGDPAAAPLQQGMAGDLPSLAATSAEKVTALTDITPEETAALATVSGPRSMPVRLCRFA
jgi:hypothetical protein